MIVTARLSDVASPYAMEMVPGWNPYCHVQLKVIVPGRTVIVFAGNVSEELQVVFVRLYIGSGSVAESPHPLNTATDTSIVAP